MIFMRYNYLSELLYSSLTFSSTSLNFCHYSETGGQIPDPEVKIFRCTHVELSGKEFSQDGMA